MTRNIFERSHNNTQETSLAEELDTKKIHQIIEAIYKRTSLQQATTANIDRVLHTLGKAFATENASLLREMKGKRSYDSAAKAIMVAQLGNLSVNPNRRYYNGLSTLYPKHKTKIPGAYRQPDDPAQTNKNNYYDPRNNKPLYARNPEHKTKIPTVSLKRPSLTLPTTTRMDINGMRLHYGSSSERKNSSEQNTEFLNNSTVNGESVYYLGNGIYGNEHSIYEGDDRDVRAGTIELN